MTKGNWPNCRALTHKWERGKVDHPKDPGGRTNDGVTQRVYDGYRHRQNKPPRDVYQMTEAEAEVIFRDQYWRPVRGDDLPAGIDAVTYDAAVNSGVGRGPKWTQGALKVTRDGHIGELSIKAAWDSYGAGNAPAVVQKACAARMSFLRGLLHWGTFGKGWSNRVADVEARSVKMATSGRAELRRWAANADRDHAAAKAAGTSAGGAGAATGAGGLATDALEPWMLVTLGAAVAVALLIAVLKTNHHRRRMAAYKAVLED